MCPQCNDGFYTDADGLCQECSKMVNGCTECNLERCLGCADDKIPQADGMECILPFANCDVDPKDYSIDKFTNKYVCQQCKAPFFFNYDLIDGSGQCDSCSSTLDNCVICNEDSTCRQCDTGFWPSPSGHIC